MCPSKVEKTRASLLTVIDEIDRIFADESIPNPLNQIEWDDYKEFYTRIKEAFLMEESTEEMFYSQLQRVNTFFIKTMGIDPEDLFYFESEQYIKPEYIETTTHAARSTQTKFCGSCGGEIRAGVKFCENCGANVHPTQTGPRPLPRRYSSPGRKDDEDRGIHAGWVVVIILFPIAGLLVFLGYLFSNRTKAAGLACGVSILSLVLNAFLTAFLFGPPY